MLSLLSCLRRPRPALCCSCSNLPHLVRHVNHATYRATLVMGIFLPKKVSARTRNISVYPFRPQWLPAFELYYAWTRSNCGALFAWNYSNKLFFRYRVARSETSKQNLSKRITTSSWSSSARIACPTEKILIGGLHILSRLGSPQTPTSTMK